MKNVTCAPNKKRNGDLENKTCFTYNDLVEIAKGYNKYAKNDSQYKKIDLNIKNTKDLLLKSLYNRLKNKCEEEVCWIEQPFIDKIDKAKKVLLKEFTFKPKPPKGVYTWFNTTNINDILYQYQKLYNKNFTFLGAVPCDITRIFKFDFKKLRVNTRYIGIVFNTDKHNKRGQHWVAAFIDNTTKNIDFFDSLGNKPNKYMKEFFKYFEDYCFNQNDIVHQKSNSNCGVYSCFFIIQRLKGKTMNSINSRIISDSEMTKYRKILFR
jgi:hypothetical protein